MIGKSLWVLGFVVLVSSGCVPAEAEMCAVGTAECGCTPGGSCDPGLVCSNQIRIHGAGETGSSGEEDAEGSSSPSTSESSGGGGSSESGGGGSSESGGGPLDCDPDLCVDAYCDDLEEYCLYGLQTPGWFSPDAPDTCDLCVAGFMDGRASLPLVYCDAVFACWVNCIYQEDIAGPAEVQACIEEYCDGITVDGYGLCEE